MTGILHLLVLLTVLVTLSACSGGPSGDKAASPPEPEAAANHPSPPTENTGKTKSKQSTETYRTTVEEIANHMDATIEDGWFFGEEPRMFKSFYRKVSPQLKAEFAVAYHEFIETFNQDLAHDYKTYVPYSKRADFAMDWWAKKVPQFTKEQLKMQVLWVHESIQDAGELWWRAKEKLEKEPTDSVQVMAHDEEQRMVSRYTEHQGSPGTLSDQVWKREQQAKGKN